MQLMDPWTWELDLLELGVLRSRSVQGHLRPHMKDEHAECTHSSFSLRQAEVMVSTL